MKAEQLLVHAQNSPIRTARETKQLNSGTELTKWRVPRVNSAEISRGESGANWCIDGGENLQYQIAREEVKFVDGQ